MHHVPLDIRYTATRGGGAFQNGAPIKVSGLSDPGHALIGTGFPFSIMAQWQTYHRQMEAVATGTAGIRRPGSAALDLADVAAGRFDGFWELKLAPWDLAAGTLLVREAGGLVTDLDGRPDVVRHGPVVAGNPFTPAARDTEKPHYRIFINVPAGECVPNFSEGRDQGLLNILRETITQVSGVRLFDVQSDGDHHRSVFTFVAPPDTALEAAFLAVRKASELIDLRTHKGEHPRMGATDVVPFIPIEDCTMDDCVALARTLGQRVGTELGIPVFLYGKAAARPGRERLPDVRKGEFEALREQIGTDPDKDPDYGPKHIHPSAGATAVGARPFLVAYNVYLKGGDEALAKAIAKRVRSSSGGLPAVQAMGITVAGEPQVSMNLLDIDTTPLHVAFDAVQAAAREAGADAGWSEIVGLVPERAVRTTSEAHLKLREPVLAHLLERKVRESEGSTLGAFLEQVASANPTPGGGTVAAIAGAMAAAVATMVARLTIGRKKYADVDAEFRGIMERSETLRAALVRLGDEDAASFDAVSRAYAIPKDRAAERTAAIQEALLGASRVPLETLRAAGQVAALAARSAKVGNRNAVSDAGVAALLAGAAARGAAYNVRINVASLPDKAAGAPLALEARRLLTDAEGAVQRATAAVEAAIGG